MSLLTGKERARIRKALPLSLARQQEQRAATLARLMDWPTGMPPLRYVGSGIGVLVALEREGLARRIGEDNLGQLRFVLTDEGRRIAEGAA